MSEPQVGFELPTFDEYCQDNGLTYNSGDARDQYNEYIENLKKEYWANEHEA